MSATSDSPAHAPCPRCGLPTLVGQLVDGTLVSLHVAARCYVIDWTKGTDLPRLHVSRAYPVHACEVPQRKGAADGV